MSQFVSLFRTAYFLSLLLILWLSSFLIVCIVSVVFSLLPTSILVPVADTAVLFPLCVLHFVTYLYATFVLGLFPFFLYFPLGANFCISQFSTSWSSIFFVVVLFLSFAFCVTVVVVKLLDVVHYYFIWLICFSFIVVVIA